MMPRLSRHIHGFRKADNAGSAVPPFPSICQLNSIELRREGGGRKEETA